MGVDLRTLSFCLANFFIAKRISGLFLSLFISVIKKLAKQKDNVLRSTPILLEEDKIKIISQIKGYSQEEILDTLNKIKSVLFQEGYIGKKRNNKYNDVHILAEHILNKRDIFVTKDVNDFIGKTQNKLVALK